MCTKINIINWYETQTMYKTTI